ncbi:MAG: apolipoprotein N-acyltransferase [Oligoflexia bacterium]|nr:apolipoprotein N-acyltransferase [Oligoflexia bacterium]
MRFYLALKDFFKIYKSSILSGVLFGCSFIPFPFFLLLFCLVPLWNFIYQQNSLKRVLVACFTTQFIAACIGFNWMIYTFHFFGGINWLFSFILLLLFCSAVACYVALSGWLWFVVTKKSVLNSTPVKLILFPLIFSVLHSLIPTLFPWNMGYPWFWGGLWGAQTAELWGFRFLDTVFYIFNLLFLIVYHHLYQKNQSYSGENTSSLFKFLSQLVPFFSKKDELPQQPSFLQKPSFPRKRESSEKTSKLQLEQNKIKKLMLALTRIRLDRVGVKALSGAVFLFVFLNGLGFYLKKRLPAPDENLNVILVQHNISSKEEDPKPFKNFKQKAFYALRTLTYRSLKQMKKDKVKAKDIDFIVWPEGAYPYTINKNRTRAMGLSKLVKVLKIPLVTGAFTRDGDQYSNSLVAFDREGNILQPVYDKMKLVIFGEYIPLTDKWPFLKKLFPYFGSSLTPGDSLQVQEMESKKIGWQICYEALFDHLSRELANKEAQFLVNLTNDSWYGSWQEPYQHLTMSLARAIEIRRPIIRSTNTGFSGVVYADGTLAPRSPMNKAWFYRYKVPYYKNPPKTLFMSWGYYINEIFLSLLLFFVILLSRKTRNIRFKTIA